MSRQAFGPESDNNYVQTRALREFIYECEEYCASLPIFHQYCLWRYTIGSASINKYLIFGGITEANASNARYWVYTFFLYWFNTMNVYKPKNVDHVGGRFSGYFNNPSSYQRLSPGKQLEVANQVIPMYIKLLNKIINNGPTPKNNIEVYKVASKYPDLPSDIPAEFQPKDVLQLPFNSTTVDPHFNFAPFVSPDADGYFFIIELGDAHCLYIPEWLHAYPFEREILLPSGSTLAITGTRTLTMDYVDPATVNIVNLQQKPDISMGPVYEVNEYMPTYSGVTVIQRKAFKMYQALLFN